MNEPDQTARDRGSPTAAVGVVCFRGNDVLLVRRGKPPRLGEWSLPGGRIEWGETAANAALRELAEETGVSATLLGLVDVVDAFFGDDQGASPARHYVLIDYAAVWVAGEPVAGDDAADAKFVPLPDIDTFGLWSETRRIIRAAAALRTPT